MDIKISSTEKKHILEMHKRSNRNFIFEQGGESSDTLLSKLDSKLQRFIKDNNLQKAFEMAKDGSTDKVIITKNNQKDTVSVGELKTFEENKMDTTICKKDPKKKAHCGVLNKLSRFLKSVR